MTFFAIMVSEEAKEQMKKKKQQQEQGQLPPQDSEAIQNQQNLKHLQPSHPGEFIYIGWRIQTRVRRAYKIRTLVMNIYNLRSLLNITFIIHCYM